MSLAKTQRAPRIQVTRRPLASVICPPALAFLASWREDRFWLRPEAALGGSRLSRWQQREVQEIIRHRWPSPVADSSLVTSPLDISAFIRHNQYRLVAP